MTKKVLSNLNLNQNQIQNAAIEYLSTAPATPVKGQFYFDSSINALMIYNGTEWKQSLSTADNETIIGWEIPDYSAGVSMALSYTEETVYTCPTDGVIVIDTMGFNGVYAYLKVNDNVLANRTSNNSYCYACLTGEFLVSKGDVVTAKSGYNYASNIATNSIVFFPMKGI